MIPIFYKNSTWSNQFMLISHSLQLMIFPSQFKPIYNRNLWILQCYDWLKYFAMDQGINGFRFTTQVGSNGLVRTEFLLQESKFQIFPLILLLAFSFSFWFPTIFFGACYIDSKCFCAWFNPINTCLYLTTYLT